MHATPLHAALVCMLLFYWLGLQLAFWFQVYRWFIYERARWRILIADVWRAGRAERARRELR
jgi:hypothetical protein